MAMPGVVRIVQCGCEEKLRSFRSQVRRLVVIESKGGPITYKAVVDAKTGGNIAQVKLPADGDVVPRQLNDIFFLVITAKSTRCAGGPAETDLPCSARSISFRKSRTKWW